METILAVRFFEALIARWTACWLRLLRVVGPILEPSNALTVVPGIVVAAPVSNRVAPDTTAKGPEVTDATLASSAPPDPGDMGFSCKDMSSLRRRSNRADESAAANVVAPEPNQEPVDVGAGTEPLVTMSAANLHTKWKYRYHCMACDMCDKSLCTGLNSTRSYFTLALKLNKFHTMKP